MSRLAVVEPGTLLGEAVRDAIGQDESSWSQVDLFTFDSEEVGAVTEVAGRAAIVQAVEADTFNNIDYAIFCDPDLEPVRLQTVSKRCRVILIDPFHSIDNAVPAVAGIEGAAAAGSHRLISPSPAIVMLAHLLAPLRDLAPVKIVAHVLLPASSHGKAGLDELFKQTRAILAMSNERPQETFGTQLAFNLLPWRASAATLDSQLETVLPWQLEARVQLSQAGVFHGCTGGVFLETSKSLDAEALTDRLRAHPQLEMSSNPDLLGPVDAASHDAILFGQVTSTDGHRHWLWCCADNLTLSAGNAVALARA